MRFKTQSLLGISLAAIPVYIVSELIPKKRDWFDEESHTPESEL